MSRAWACLALVALVLAPVAAAKSQPAVLFLADGQAPLGDGVLKSEWPDSNVSSMRLVTPAPTEALLLSFAANSTGGTRLYGPAFAAVWPDLALAQNGTLLRASLRIDGIAVANQTTPIVFDPENLPDPMAFVPPDPTDPQGAALHIVAQALPLIYTPGVLLYFGFVDIEVAQDAVVSVTLDVVPSGPSPFGSVVVKYDSVFTPSYVFLPWWVPDPAPTVTNGPTPTATATPSPSPSAPPTETSAPSKDSPALPLVGALVVLGFIAVRRRL